LIVVSLAFWILDLRPIMWSVLCIGILIVSLKLLRAWVDHAFDDAIADYMAKLPPPPVVEASDGPATDAEAEQEEVAEVIDPYDTYRPIAQRVVRFAAIITAGFALVSIWNLGIFDNADDPTVMQRVVSVLIDSAAALLIADLVWTWARTAIDRRLSAYRPPTDGSAPGPEARMATLLPLLRVVLMVTLLLMVAMSILSSMGVNIAPILAGASVLGIAIGFGAQSLVKDVVSGIFFLIDDAFRVGEYVEIDQLRGTVEKISIRSLQIRHHRGAVHTLPFGELKSMTNYSRDWVIMKLEFRVPFDTDLKLVKKLIKQVGAQLKESPLYGDSIIETLKSQGVRRMEEFNMVVGVKFMTRPGEQWTVRRDAYQMVRDIFDANGIRMAERNVKVEIAGDEALTDEQRKAVSAAAHEATVNKLPPGPVPDEP
jgi:small-conductance mechanosensitive channel